MHERLGPRGSSDRRARLRPRLALALLLALPGAAAAQVASEAFTLERIHASEDFSAESFSGRWMADGEAWVALERTDDGAAELWRVEAESGARTPILRASDLVPAGASEPLAVDDFSFSRDERKILLFTDAQQVWRSRTKGIYWIYDRDARTLRPVSERPGWQMFAKFSPQGDRVAFVRDHDLFVTDLRTGEERRLTDSGSETIINGTTDWVYEEELGLRDAFRWSPDGRRIAYWQLDQSPIREFHLLDEMQLYPDVLPIRYPKAGTDNSLVRVGSLELESGETRWFELPCDRERVAGGEECYIARMEWIEPGNVVIQTLNRHQSRLELLEGDAATGAVRTILVEEDAAWVDVNDDVRWIDDGRRFVWTSERDGWKHIYLYRRDGTLERQLTSGAWEVSGIEAVDDERDRVYFTAARLGPTTRSVLSVDTRGRVRPVFAEDRGWAEASFAPGFRYAVLTHSTIERPPVVTLAELRGAEAEAVRVLVDNAELVARLDSAGLGPTEFLRLEAADGTPLNAYVVKPPDFDPSRRYGVLMYVYGGPGSQTVVDRWSGSRHLWHHYLARRGVLVASVDNRGTGGRGRDFEKQTYRRLGQLETADQLAALSQLAALPYVADERVGIWGWSYGGYMTLMTTLLGDGRVAAGASVAPVTDWKLYDTIYTERYMRTPGENPEGYEQGAPLTHAARLASPLLIVHGTGDDNVHAQNSLQMVEALEAAGKQFRMRLYPNKRHGISGGEARVNLFEMLTDFALEHLRPTDAAAHAAGATDGS